jgi:hypothetical protein
MQRTLTLALAAAVLAVAFLLGRSSVPAPANANAGRADATLADVVRQLRSANTALSAIQKSLQSGSLGPTVQDQLREICEGRVSRCRQGHDLPVDLLHRVHGGRPSQRRLVRGERAHRYP